jgi:hypothetical protein
VNSSRRIGMRPRAWLTGFPRFSAIAQITARSLKCCLSLCEGQFLFAPWHGNVLRSFSVFYFSQKMCVLLKINCSAFYVCEAILCIDYWYYSKFLEPYIFHIRKNSKFVIPMFVIPMFVTVVLVPLTSRLYYIHEVWRREEITYELEGRGVSASGCRHSVAQHFLPVGREMQLRWMKEMQAVSCSDSVACERSAAETDG